MSVEPTSPTERSLIVDDQERAVLVELLERELGESRVEARRTRTPDFKEQVLHEEEMVRRLIAKLQRLAT